MHTPPAIDNPQYPFQADWVIYADDDIIVANKPSGLLSVPGRGDDKYESLASHLDHHYPGARIVHRLDMDTSGIMVLARHAEAHRHLSRQFQDRQTAKRYLAVCIGKPNATHGSIKLPMRCDWENRPLQMIDFYHGKYAETHWQLIEQYNDRFLVELTPVTGRSHQLRLHMKSLGHPILGDNLYADLTSLKMASRLLLHAAELSFFHPKNEQWLTFKTPAAFN